ncbi:MAG TPA: glycoside hydrolase family 172 protein [Pyrinomonadaceae bacterium]|nr:glycoside hydrolase family 172 protein [Pyrinomonadaceae bacterium]
MRRLRIVTRVFNFIFLSACFFLAGAVAARAQVLYELPEGVETRWASPENPSGEKGAGGRALGGRKGAPTIAIKAGASAVLAEARGTSGTVRRMWMTIPERTPRMLRGLRLDIYWDGAGRPAVSAPLGDFFGVGLGRMAKFESALFSNPEGRSFNCVVPMPFRTGMRIVMTNESGVDLPELFYDINYTLGDRHPPGVLYFHAHFRRENPTRLRQDYEILPRVEGRGRYLGTNVGVTTDRATYSHTWWGEGEIKIYLDGDRELPSLVGTGTEDYVGTAWGQGEYSNLYQGSPVADERAGQWSFYRYHVPDPVYFSRDIRVTMQQIGYLADHSRGGFYRTGKRLLRAGPGEVEMDLTKDGKFERSDDWSSCAYFYLDRPENDLPKLDAAEKRMAGL